MSSAAPSPERQRVLELVARNGWNATAFQALEEGYLYFFHGSDGCVAYVDTGAAWVAAGAPIVRTEELASVVEAFVAAARQARRRCCFFATEERLHTSTGQALESLCIGEQPVWNPLTWTTVLSQARSLREQLRRARAKRVSVRRLDTAELECGPTRDQLARIAARWQGARALAPMGFLVRLELFTFPAERRCFVAEQDGRVVAIAGVIPVPARRGWFLEDLVRDPKAPNGTSELLVDAVMSWANEDGSRWLTFGLAPLSGALPHWLKIVRRVTSGLYDFEGLRAYKAKFKPETWSPIFLSYPRGQSQFAAIADALSAFAQGGLVRFAWRSLLRGPTVVLRALSLFLLPWTGLLALAPSGRWFGAEWVKWAWICFDLCVAFALFEILKRPAPKLINALCVAVTADALVTTLEVTLWNFGHAKSSVDYLVLALGCGAPTLAAVVLWGARHHRLHFG